MTDTPVICCGEPMEYVAAYEAEPDTNTAAWLGGYSCSGCGKMRENPPFDEAEGPEPFDEFTGPMPIDPRRSA